MEGLSSQELELKAECVHHKVKVPQSANARCWALKGSHYYVSFTGRAQPFGFLRLAEYRDVFGIARRV